MPYSSVCDVVQKRVKNKGNSRRAGCGRKFAPVRPSVLVRVALCVSLRRVRARL